MWGYRDIFAVSIVHYLYTSTHVTITIFIILVILFLIFFYFYFRFFCSVRHPRFTVAYSTSCSLHHTVPYYTKSFFMIILHNLLRTLLGDSHPDTVVTMYNMSELLLIQGSESKHQVSRNSSEFIAFYSLLRYKVGDWKVDGGVI